MTLNKKYISPETYLQEIDYPLPLAISGGSGSGNSGTLQPEDDEFNGTFQSQQQHWEKSAWQE